MLKRAKLTSFAVPFLAPEEALAILEVVGAAADPVCGEDKVVAIAAAVVVAVTPVLAQHVANRKAQHLLGMVHAKNATKTIQATHT
jgi:hypothetical protein